MANNFERQLLFATLALQFDLISDQQFTEACSHLSAHKEKDIAQFLVAKRWLTLDASDEIQRVLERKLQHHQNNAGSALAGVTTDQIRRTLATIDDPDINKTMNWLPQGHVLLESVEKTPGVRDRYTLSRLHATGGIGRVWLARDPAFGREVALKELRPERASNTLDLDRFLREAKVTGQLEHPGIVPVYEVGRGPDEQSPFYTMRFVRGQTLAEAARHYHILRERGEVAALEARELLTAFVGVCNAIAYAHSRGVIHRDLKPQNVVLGDFGEVIVLDWGLARLTGVPDEVSSLAIAGDQSPELGTVQGQVLGTPAYMAPEQAEGRQDDVDVRTDVYGLGAILYEVLTGRPPFVGPDLPSLLRDVIGKPPAPPRSLVPATDRALEAICLKALAKQPIHRYATAGILGDEIRHWLADDPVEAYREPWLARSKRWLRRHQTLATTCAAVLLVAAFMLTTAALLLNLKNRQLEQANLNERTANEALTQSNQRERAAREQAEANFGLAKNAVDKYLNAVTAEPDLKKSDFNKLRKKLMETAIPFYETFLAQKLSDPEQEAARGDAYQRLASLRTEMGEQKAALAEAEKAREIFGGLSAAHPRQTTYRERLAQAHRGVGISLAGGGAMVQGATALEQAVQEYEKLAKESPDRPELAEEQANCQNSVGVIMHNLGRHHEAEAAYNKALSLREDLARHHAEAKFRHGLARTLNSLGVLAKDQGNFERAEVFHARAREQREKLLAEQPDNANFHSDLAMSYNNLGAVYSDSGQFVKATEIFRRGADIRNRLAEKFPTIVLHRQLLGTIKYNLGYCLESTGRLEEAAPVYQEAEAIQSRLVKDSPTMTDFQLDLGRTRCNLGLVLARLNRFDASETTLRTTIADLTKRPANAPADWLAQQAIAYRNLGEALRDRGQAQTALPWFEKSVSSMQDCLHNAPGLAGAASVLADIHAQHARTYEVLGKSAEARAAWELAVRAGNAGFRSFLLLSEGKTGEAVMLAQKTAQAQSAGGEVAYTQARLCALAAAKSQEPDRETYLLKALALLKLAKTREFDPGAGMKFDSAFATSRSNAEFLKLQSTLDTQGKK